MIRTVIRIGVILGLPLLGGSGCIEQDLTFTLCPDGSGKIDVETRMSEDLDLYALFLESLEMLEEMGEEGEAEAEKIRRSFERSLFDKVGQQIRGLKAWTLPTFTRKGEGLTVYTFTGYFDDINKLRLLGGEEGQFYESFTFESEEDGSPQFRAHGNMKKVRGAVKRTGEEKEEAREEWKALKKGFRGVKPLGK